jgi:hypothetical protein
MRALRPSPYILLLACCLCLYLHAQSDTSCKIPEPGPGQSKDQEEAAASGYLAACKAAEAPDAHQTGKEPETAGHLDDEVDLDVPADRAKWQIDDYLKWIRQEGCLSLYREAKKKVAKYAPDYRKTYLASIVQVMEEQNKCN